MLDDLKPFFNKENVAVDVFPAKKASKFRDWLDCSTLELKPNSLAMEILSYLAYETVAQVCRSFNYFSCKIKSILSRTIINLSPSDCGFVSVGEAGNDSEVQSHQSCDLCQLYSLQHSH